MFMAPVIQRMVKSHVSGILYTSNPKPGSKDKMRVEANWGLGDAVISGTSMSDSFILNKATVVPAFRTSSRCLKGFFIETTMRSNALLWV